MMRAFHGRRILPVLFSIATIAFPGAPVQAALIPPSRAPEIDIRVRLSEGASVVDVRGYDLRIFDAHGARRLAAVASRESEWRLRCEDGRVRAERVAGEGLGENSLDLPEPVVVQSPAGFVRLGGKPYRDELRIYSAGSLCEVVNELSLEKYLEGLVNAEFNSKWNEQAIGAQVVAARTYALFQIRKTREFNEDQHYDIDATTYDQVYDGSMKEDSRAARIVEKTRGLVLTIRGPKGIVPLKAYYSSTCGGMTELPHEVWGTSDQGFRRVHCPYCRFSPAAHWSFDLSSAQIIEALRKATRNGITDSSRFPRDWRKILAQGRLRSIRITGYDLSGRVEKVILDFALGNQLREWMISGARFREWLGAARFKSTSFGMQLAASANGALVWHFSGRGNGHGVGMCQWGAKTMGERGFKTAQILKFYYPDAQLRKLW